MFLLLLMIVFYYYWWLLLFFYYWWLFVIIDNYYWWLFFYYWWLFDYVSAVCINGGERTTFHKIFRKLILLIQKLWIISINSVRNLHILNFSRKNNNIKNLKKCLRKVVLAPPFIHTTLNPLILNLTKWSNTPKQFIGCWKRIVWVCLTILWGWHLKG